MAARHSGYARIRHDYYREPNWCVDNLFDTITFVGAIHDPCCGAGTIVDTAQCRGLVATGADIVDRANGRFPIVDFFADTRTHENLVTNPPYRQAEKILVHALQYVVPDGTIAVIVPIQFLCSQGRRHLFDRHWCDRVLIHSRRPSMPPGDLIELFGENERHSGSTDYCWIVFRPGRAPTAPVEIDWLAP